MESNEFRLITFQRLAGLGRMILRQNNSLRAGIIAMENHED
jgi:hypothetical protein